MRDLGYSKRQAREIVSHGFRGLTEADPDVSDELAALLKRALTQLERKDTV